MKQIDELVKSRKARLCERERPGSRISSQNRLCCKRKRSSILIQSSSPDSVVTYLVRPPGFATGHRRWTHLSHKGPVIWVRHRSIDWTKRGSNQHPESSPEASASSSYGRPTNFLSRKKEKKTRKPSFRRQMVSRARMSPYLSIGNPTAVMTCICMQATFGSNEQDIYIRLMRCDRKKSGEVRSCLFEPALSPVTGNQFPLSIRVSEVQHRACTVPTLKVGDGTKWGFTL